MKSWIVVSSIRAADLDMGATKAEGVRHLHRYLDFAQRGLEALEQPVHANGSEEASSPLEADLVAEVRKLGYEVVQQVGCSGYRIDVGVIDPEAPSQFLLGIECDGPSYHATPTARDRDRLRHEVLERLGWQLHRVWATEWFQRRHQELERLREALEAAKKTVAKSHGDLLEVQHIPKPPATKTSPEGIPLNRL